MIVKGSYSTDKELILEAAGKYLNELLRDAIDGNKQVLLALSGGSCLNLLSHIDIDSLSSNVTITVLDERYSQDPKVNNTAQIISRGFVESIRMKHINFVDMRVKDNESQGNLESRFNEVLDNWIKKNPGGVIIATLGMGADGHTSGIISNTEGFQELFDGENKNKYVVAYTAKNEFPLRVTTTMHFLRKIDKGILLVLGDEKMEALSRMMSENGDLSETPAKIYKEIPGEIRLFTDLAEII